MAGCGNLWQPLADLSDPFKMMQSSELHSTGQVDSNLQAGRLQGIPVMADWSLEDSKVLVDNNVMEHALAVEEVGG